MHIIMLLINMRKFYACVEFQTMSMKWEYDNRTIIDTKWILRASI